MTLENKLRNFMASKNLPLNTDIFYIDGTIHRYSAKANGSKDEYYSCQIIEGNHFRCMFGSWSGNQPRYFWNSFKKNEISDYDEKIEKINKQFEIEREIKQEKTKEEFTRFWNDLEPCNEHPYLIRKKIKAHDVKKRDNFLYVPYYSHDEKVSTCVRIDKEGNKRNYTGLSTKLLFHPFGSVENAKEIIFCEGYATANSIYECTKKTTISCGSCHNVAMVAQIFSNKYPDTKISYAMDNGEAGEKVKVEWNTYFNKNIYTPTHNESDFNDIFCKYGKEEVEKIFEDKKLPSFNLQELFEENFTPEEWINNIMYQSSINIIFADDGIGKTRLGHELAFCMCSNSQFLRIKPARAFTVLYIDGEMTGFKTKDRMKGIANRYPDVDFDIDNLKFVLNMEFRKRKLPKINLYDQEVRRSIDVLIKDRDVIFLDNLGTLTEVPKGEGYKSDLIEWNGLNDWMQEWMSLGKTFIIFMHENKIGEVQGVKRITSDADLSIQLKKPESIDVESLCHFDFIFHKTRSLTNKQKKNYSAKLMPERKQSHGWFHQDLDE